MSSIICCKPAIWMFYIWMISLSMMCSVESSALKIVDVTTADKDSPVQINCSDYQDKDFKWMYQSSVAEKPRAIAKDNSTYDIVSPAATGFYNCTFGGSVLSKYQAVNFSQPYIPHHGRSMIFTEGDVNQTIECFSYSYPTPQFNWSVTYPQGQYVVLTGIVSNTYSIVNNGTRSTLTMALVSEHNRGWYNCSANNVASSATTSVQIRVHAKLAALWPFLGIVCEVLIVVCIILVVRAKPLGEESDFGDALRDTNSSESSRDEPFTKVRFRKAGGSSQNQI